jgi:imidazolonepropionase-like amidohydrolase
MIDWILTLGLATSVAPEPAPRVEPDEVPPARLALRASTLRADAGTSIENGVVLIEGGRVLAVGADVEIPSGTPVIELDGVLSAGLVAARSHAGLESTGDPTRSVNDGMHVADQFRPEHSDFRRLLAAGVTTVVLAPGGSTLCGGRTAVVKTVGGTVLERDAHLALSFTSGALESTRFPTSYATAVEELDRLLGEGEGAFGSVAGGELPVFLETGARHQVQRACDFAIRHGLKGALGISSYSGELFETIEASGLTAVVGPFDAGTGRRTLEATVSLTESGVPVAFGLRSPARGVDELRLTAALCARAGMDRQAAFAGLTSEAARAAGVDGRVGKVARGLDADLVLWSGDPLDLASSVRAVWVAGEKVHGEVHAPEDADEKHGGEHE